MKKIVFGFIILSMLSSCFIFKKKEKYGCPNDARGKSPDEIAAKANKHKYKGGKKTY
ncbi:hypothetical protein BH11BAC4_BH11BAC4_11350 [soil metagenome]